MRAEVTKSFKWFGESVEGIEFEVGSVVEGDVALNAVDMGCAVEVVDDDAGERKQRKAKAS